MNFHVGNERQVVTKEWLANYFAPQWDDFTKEVKRVVFHTGFTEEEVFDEFCKLYRPNGVELCPEDLEPFKQLNDSWFNLADSFHEKYAPLKIFPDYYDPELASDDDTIKGGFIGLSGAYILHPVAERIASAFSNHQFVNSFKHNHRLFFVESK